MDSLPPMPETANHTPAATPALMRWVSACLADPPRLPDGELPLAAAEAEGVLPWLGWRLHESGGLAALPAGQQAELRQSLRRWGLMHVDCEAELERLAVSAAQRGLRFLAFKGHAVARTLYPHPACRPTSDFDLLVAPAQLGVAQAWLAEQGYTPLQRFVGRVWLGAQSWSLGPAGAARFHADLHWDYSNRMYFRRRLPFGELWGAALEVPCGEAALRVPCPPDNLLLACVHLAAFEPGLRVRLAWLLDIYLLLASLDAADLDVLLERAARARAVEACLEFGEWAAALGPAAPLRAALQALRGAADARRWRGYRRTLRWRAWDLACYWARLPGGDRLRFFSDMARWVTAR